jgi:hypothetical protein
MRGNENGVKKKGTSRARLKSNFVPKPLSGLKIFYKVISKNHFVWGVRRGNKKNDSLK